MIYPTGILKNTKTGRFHPISFRAAPMPGNADGNLSAQRFKSLGHHTDGFAAIEEARAWIATKHTPDDTMIDTGEQWEWDGVEVPAMVQFYDIARLAEDHANSRARANG